MSETSTVQRSPDSLSSHANTPVAEQLDALDEYLTNRDGYGLIDSPLWLADHIESNDIKSGQPFDVRGKSNYLTSLNDLLDLDTWHSYMDATMTDAANVQSLSAPAIVAWNRFHDRLPKDNAGLPSDSFEIFKEYVSRKLDLHHVVRKALVAAEIQDPATTDGMAAGLTKRAVFLGVLRGEISDEPVQVVSDSAPLGHTNKAMAVATIAGTAAVASPLGAAPTAVATMPAAIAPARDLSQASVTHIGTVESRRERLKRRIVVGAVAALAVLATAVGLASAYGSDGPEAGQQPVVTTTPAAPTATQSPSVAPTPTQKPNPGTVHNPAHHIHKPKSVETHKKPSTAGTFSFVLDDYRGDTVWNHYAPYYEHQAGKSTSDKDFKRELRWIKQYNHISDFHKIAFGTTIVARTVDKA